MSYTAKEFKAMQWYLDKENCVPELGIYPRFRGRNRITGKVVEVNVKSITAQYEAEVKEARKEATKERKREAASR